MKKNLATLFACLVTASFALSSHAAVLFWDVNGATAPCGGTGNWNTNGTAFWSTACDTAGVNWNNANGDSAVFTVASAPTLTTAITVNNIQTDVGVIFANGGNIANRFTFSGASAGLNCTHTTGATTLTAPYVGSVFTKSGPGELLLNNSTAGLAPGRWVVTGGFLAMPAWSRVRSTTALATLTTNYLTLDGGGIGTSLAGADFLGPNGGVVLGAGGGFFGASNAGNQPGIDGPISGPGGFTVTGGAPFYSPYASGGIWTLSNTNNSYGGATTVTAGGLTVGAAGVIPDSSAVTLNGGDLVCAFPETVRSLILNSVNSAASGAGPFTATNLPTSYTLRNGTCSLVLAGANSTALKNSASTVTLSGGNTFAGGFTFTAGTLLVNNNAALGLANSPVSMANGVTLSASTNTARTLTYVYAINGDITIGQAVNGIGALTLGGSVNLGGGVRTLTINNPTDTISAVITNGGLTKAGPGTLLLTGTNIYDGPTTINSGKLVTTAASTGGGSYTLVDGATLGIASTAAGGSLVMSDFTAGSSTMEFDFARLPFPASKMVNDLGAITVNGNVSVDVKGFESGGTVTLLEYAGPRNGGGSFVTGIIPPHMAASITDDTINNKVILNAAAADSLIWVGDGSGNWDINSGNPIWKLASDGATLTDYQENAVSQGDIVKFDDTATGTTAINLSTILSPYRTTVNNAALSYILAGTGKISGGGNLIKNGSGELTMATINDYTGGTTLSAGTINLATNTVFGTGKLTVNGNIVIRSDSASAPARTVAVATEITNATLTLGDDVNTGDMTFSGVIAGNGGVIKAGNGILNLTGANTFSGGVTHMAGTLRVNNNASLGLANSTVNLGQGVTLSTTTTTARTLTYAFNVNGDITMGQAAGGTAALTLAGSVNLAGANRTISVVTPVATNMTISGVITNGGLTKTGIGTLILTGANTYSGGTTVSEGVLQGSTSGLQGNITNNTTVVFNQTTTGTYAGVLSGSGILVKIGSGSVALSGANTYAGGTIVSNGTLLINGSLASANVAVNLGATLGGNGAVYGPVTVNAGGSIGAGSTSAGLLTLTNGLSLAAGGTNVWELAANSTGNPGTDFDQIALSGGNLALGGNSRLLLRFIGSSTSPTNTDSFWQSPRSWKIISLSGAASNSGSSTFFGISGTNNITAGVFSTSVDGSGSVLLNFTPSVMQPEIERNIVGAGTTSAQLSWSSVDGTSYTVQYKTNLNQVGWITLGTVIGTGTRTTFIDNTSPAPNERYYRIISP